MPDIIGKVQAVSLAGTVTSGQTMSDRLQELADRFPTVEPGQDVTVATPGDIAESENRILQSISDLHNLTMGNPIQTSDDLNEYLGSGKEGVYNIPYDATPANCPGATGWRTLFVYTQPGGDITRQILINFQSHEYYYRVFTSNQWYDWEYIGDRIAREQISAISDKIDGSHYLGMGNPIQTSENLNDYRGDGKIGVYNLPYDATPANCPGATGWRTLFVMAQPDSPITRQIIINFQSHEYYYRVYTSNKWYEWEYIGDRIAREQISELSSKVDSISATLTGDGKELLSKYGTFTDATSNGVTFHWVEPGVCKVSGTAKSFVFRSCFESLSAIPSWLVKGKKYTVKAHSETGEMLFQIFSYKNGVETGYRFFEDGEFTLPTDADGVLFRIRSYFGTYPVTIDDTITFGFYESTNVGIGNRVDKLESEMETNTGKIQGLTIGDTNVIDYVNDASTVSTPNSGHTLNVLTYNVAYYNNDTTTYLSDKQVCNFKRFLSTAKADVVCIQEHRNYIDPGSTKDAHNYLYRPVYPIRCGTDNSIFTKLQTANTGTIAYSADSARNFSYGIMTIGTKKLLIVSTHLSTGNDATGQNKRRTEYDELLKWVHGEVTLSGKQVPAWDYCVIGGDFNSAQNVDKQNLKELSAARGFSMSNGGWLGWIQTNTWNTPIDSVMCSSNVIINSIDVYESWKNDLYSDHYPMVCNITLVGA